MMSCLEDNLIARARLLQADIYIVAALLTPRKDDVRKL